MPTRWMGKQAGGLSEDQGPLSGARHSPLHSQIPSQRLCKSGRILWSDNWRTLQDYFWHVCLDKNKHTKSSKNCEPQSQGVGCMAIPRDGGPSRARTQISRKRRLPILTSNFLGPCAHRSPRPSVLHVWHLSWRIEVTVSLSIWLCIFWHLQGETEAQCN